MCSLRRCRGLLAPSSDDLARPHFQTRNQPPHPPPLGCASANSILLGSASTWPGRVSRVSQSNLPRESCTKSPIDHRPTAGQQTAGQPRDSLLSPRPEIDASAAQSLEIFRTPQSILFLFLFLFLGHCLALQLFFTGAYLRVPFGPQNALSAAYLQVSK